MKENQKDIDRLLPELRELIERRDSVDHASNNF
jgi:hypothetical protein